MEMMMTVFLSCLFYVAIIYAIHELGHVIAVLAVGGRVVGLTVGWRGVGVKWQGDTDPFKQIVVALSGPAANLVVFAVCFAVSGCLVGGGWLGLFGICNLVFAVANLVLPGGDGARAVRILRLRGEY